MWSFFQESLTRLDAMKDALVKDMQQCAVQCTELLPATAACLPSYRDAEGAFTGLWRTSTMQHSAKPMSW